MADTVRTNVVMTSELHQWYKEQSDNIGITMSALLTIALHNYRKETDQKAAPSNKQPE